MSKPATDPETIKKEIEELRQGVVAQGNLVRQLKEQGVPKADLSKAVNQLKALKATLEEKELLLAPPQPDFDRAKFEQLMTRRLFWTPSFEIYGGVAGLYDYGPTGCAIKANFLNAWRSHFVLEEQMLEVDCSMLTVENVLKASGHVARFADLLVRDVNDKNICFRADHLLEAHLEANLKSNTLSPAVRSEMETVLVRIDNYNKTELGEMMKKYNVRAPETGNELTEPEEFNLMFATNIGPSGLIKGYLRPETAQGIFVNFRKLYEFNNSRLPFAAAQIGNSFRNEIAPRSGLLRVREFTMAEIEHFVHPDKKAHPKFESIADLQINLYSAEDQMSGRNAAKVRLGDAVKAGTIANETLGYFLGRIQLFLAKVGVNDAKLRFRQHLANEMAHYACDCWDAECKTSYGWVECIGCADRSAYDLKQHTSHSGVKLVANETLEKPIIEEVFEAVFDKSLMGKAFKKDSAAITDCIAKQPRPALEELAAKLAADGKIKVVLDDKREFEISSQMLSFQKRSKETHVEEFTPSVIEPSFGIGRIIYSILEHNFEKRGDDEQRNYLTLPAILAPYKCSVIPISAKPAFAPILKEIASLLTLNDISSKVDDSNVSIGRRYARTDEIGISFAITVDFDTLNDKSVTLRERDSTKQVRLNIQDAVDCVRAICTSRMQWSDVVAKYPAFTTAPEK